MKRHVLAMLSVLAIAGPTAAEEEQKDLVQQIFGEIVRSSGLSGEMTATMPGTSDADEPLAEVLRFEPWQMLDDLFRDDIVLLMRHGPTDWSKRDATDVAPTDCENQRVMTDLGKRQMRDLGTLLVANEMIPGRIIVSEWCRNQETLAALQDGMDRAQPGLSGGIETETFAEANLLLSLQGAPNVTAMRELISGWDGGAEEGPLLIISHFTNIQELTQFNVYEGEMLVVDPERDNRVLGYLRLRSSGPDIGHFDAEVVEATAQGR
ncbi:histidine phosphatase family protein [Jannaschia marina]|uniref:histidine phosphatase family protein n=1 Tax=Jannaschia marina TaxID=2741674 RepID=UPI0015C87C77|nr:histidine phosphatase family protein [Jannaschia marina]